MKKLKKQKKNKEEITLKILHKIKLKIIFSFVYDTQHK